MPFSSSSACCFSGAEHGHPHQIYTRGGDAGLTGLGTGERRRKDDLRIEAYGAVDEANSFIGVAAVLLNAPEHTALAAILAAIQNDLFDLGADLCVPETDQEGRTLRITQPQVDRLEREIDALNADLEPLKSFILPGGPKRPRRCMSPAPWSGARNDAWLRSRRRQAKENRGADAQIYQPSV